MTRSQSRKNAFLLLFALYTNDELITEEEQLLEDGQSIRPDAFCRRLVDVTRDNLAAVDDAIRANLQGWTLQRLPKASLAILRLSAAQLLFCSDIPVSVVINEAVELSKQFGSPDDYVFINGALGSLARSLPARTEQEEK